MFNSVIFQNILFVNLTTFGQVHNLFAFMCIARMMNYQSRDRKLICAIQLAILAHNLPVGIKEYQKIPWYLITGPKFEPEISRVGTKGANDYAQISDTKLHTENLLIISNKYN
jgi:hypothetical protein